MDTATSFISNPNIILENEDYFSVEVVSAL